MAKEKSLAELRADKAEAVKRAKEITEKAKAETRKLNDDEMKEHNELNVRIAELNTDILAHEEENRGRGVPAAKTEKFSLRRAIVAQMNHQPMRDSEASVIAEAAQLHRSVSSESTGDLIVPFETRAALTAGTEATTGVLIDEDQMEMLLPLEANLVLSAAGARIMTGLVGNLYWPKTTAASVTWEGENVAAKDGVNTVSKGTAFTPKRLTAYVDISKQLLVQENRSVEHLVRQLLAQAIAQKIEQTAFSAAVHADGVPDGLFQNFTAKGAMSWANIVAMETAADLNNAQFGNLAYILHPSLAGAAKTKVKDASGAGGFIIGDGGKGFLNGYNAFRTNNLPDELGTNTDEFGSVFGNWAHYFLGQWGAIDITVDPYTLATTGMVRLTVNSYWDMGQIRTESFSVYSMK